MYLYVISMRLDGEDVAFYTVVRQHPSSGIRLRVDRQRLDEPFTPVTEFPETDVEEGEYYEFGDEEGR